MSTIAPKHSSQANTLTDDDFAELIKRSGGETCFLSASRYYFLISVLNKRFPSLDDHINTHTMLTGHGWGMCCDSTYGITFEGIRRVLEIKKIQARVLTTLEELSDVFLHLQDNQILSCVADSGVLVHSDGKSSTHAVSMFLLKEKNIIRVAVLDSEGEFAYSSSLKKIKKLMSEGLILGLACSTVVRQKSGEATCYGFAISDCIAVQNDPNLLRKMLGSSDKVKGDFEGDHQAEIRQLPSELLTLTKGTTARQRALEYQALLVIDAKNGVSF